MVLFVSSIVQNWDFIMRLIRFKKQETKKQKGSRLWYLPAVLLIVVQMYAGIFYTHIDDDDAFYVATASTTLETDTVFQYNAYTGDEYESLPSRYVLSPFPIFEAGLWSTFNRFGTYGNVFDFSSGCLFCLRPAWQFFLEK